MVVGTANRSSYWIYRCPPTGDCQQRVTISAEIAEKKVIEKVRAAIADDEGRASAEANVRDAEAALGAAEIALKNTIRSLAVVADEPETQSRLLELRQDRDRAREHLDQLGGQQAAVVINGADDWDRLSFDARRALIRATVERAAVTKDGRGAERVRVKLFGE
jgi:hypothetical protein